LAHVEASESADFNFVAGSQGTDDTVKYGANDDVGFLPGHLHGLRNLFGQIGSNHLAYNTLDHEKEYHSVPLPRTTPPGTRTPGRYSVAFVAHHDAPLIGERAAMHGRGAMEGGDDPVGVSSALLVEAPG